MSEVMKPAVLGRTLQFTTVKAKGGQPLFTWLSVAAEGEGEGVHLASKKSSTRLMRPVSNK